MGEYSPLILDTCQFSTSDPDQAADCFLFACEQLSRNQFRRLLQFRPDGAASFPTWLRVVVRNLCLDWRRKQFGRLRLFRSIGRLAQLEVEVYRCRYEQGFSLDDTLLYLSPSFPGLTIQQLVETEAHVQESLSGRQLWLMNARKARARVPVQQSASGPEEDGSEELEAVDPRPNQELEFVEHELQENLRSAVRRLSPQQRLLIRFRFEEGLSLEQIARLTGLGDAQRVHRRLADILTMLRKKVA